MADPGGREIPRTQKFLLGDRIQTTALDILEALIDATYSRDRTAALARANLGIEKLRFYAEAPGTARIAFVAVMASEQTSVQGRS